MKDIRISFNLLDHPKKIKLQRRCGQPSFENLLRFWMFVAQTKPKGILNGISCEDIEIASKWEGETGVFYSTLVEVGFLRIENDKCYVNDWEEHNGFAFYSPERIEKASNAAKVRWEKHKENKQLMLNDATSNAKGMLNDATSNAPSPAPSPSPKDNTHTPIPYQTIMDLFNEKCADVFPKILRLNEKRKKLIKNCWMRKETTPAGRCSNTLDFWEKYFEYAATMPLLNGKKLTWVASFDWLLKPDNLLKVLEGNYEKKENSNS